MPNKLNLTGDTEADQLLSDDPFALMTGMLLDQQIGMEIAFTGPKKIAERMSGFDVAAIAASDLDDFVELCVRKPAIHRYGGSMGKRVHALAQHVVEHYDGEADRIWTAGDPEGKEILKRLRALPGYGEQKAKIFLALLGKQLGLTAPGWREAAGAYGEPDSRRSIADVVDHNTLLEVREFKRAMKAEAKKAKS